MELGAGGGPRHPRDAYLERDVSPDGRIMVEYQIEPQRMSHETRVPRIIDLESGDTLLTMPDSLYDGTVHWRGEGAAQLSIRHYDGGHADLFIDFTSRTFTSSGSSEPQPLAKAGREIARQIHRSRAAPAAVGEPMKVRPAWGAVLFMILLGIVAVGAIALVSRALAAEKKSTLTPLPKFSAPR